MMLKTNDIFFEFISKTWIKYKYMDDALSPLLQKGLVEVGNLLLLSELNDSRVIPAESLFDDIDKEVFINNFHSDDYLNSFQIEEHWINMILFCKNLKSYLPENRSYFVYMILSQTEYGVNFKMYKDREIEYLSENIDKYQQGIIQFKF
ncbi:hypothetical protein EGK75_13535 [Neisseria weixii]|uniref:Uncharacterized protein n=1 Tax=Neisseria weixii TaxID=1853276 RepID=A0A3N4MHK8_9NEIS|nr:hypothetical protein [Neisseria weixii]RPD83084.1 hypothetical protein EGK74_13560 [Neisseria weixii]RPD83254.1 hypothetical protein EGK75_13535 [Neisseria weixii]